MNSQLQARGTRLSLAQRLARHRQIAVLQRPLPPMEVDQPAWRTAGVQLVQAKPYSEEVSTSADGLAQRAPQLSAPQAFSAPEQARGGQVTRLTEGNPVSVERPSTTVERASTPVDRPSTPVDELSTGHKIAPIKPIRAVGEVQRTPDRANLIPASAETAPIQGEEPPGAEQPAPQQSDESTWKRLQAIFHRHQSTGQPAEPQETSQEARAEFASPPPGLQRTSSSEIGGNMQPVERPQDSDSRSQVKTGAGESGARIDSAKENKPLASADPAGMKATPVQPGQTSQLEPAQDDPPEAVPEASAQPVETNPTGSDSDLPDAKAAAPTGLTPSASQTQPDALPMPEALARLHTPAYRGPQIPQGSSLQRKAALPEGLPEEPGESGSAGVGQPLPLEAAWPVERREDLPPTGLRAGSQPKAEAFSEQSPERHSPQGAAEPQRTRDLLKKVQSGQPSESQIEFVAPRKARPSAVQAAPSNRLAPEQPPAASIQTEIGPLPSDLWQLIGETPPKGISSRVQRAESDDKAQKTERTRPEGPSPLAAAQPAHSAPVHSAVFDDAVAPEFPGQMAVVQPGSVQRQEDESARAIQAGADERQPASSAQSRAESQSPDNSGLDELVRQVYAEIRRRLSVEREWFRGGH